MSDDLTYPLTDLDLARRLERAEGVSNAAFVEARAQVQPGVAATWMDVAGVYAMYDGVESPLTQTFGLGVFEAIGDAELEQIEAFFLARGAPVYHEVCPLIPQEMLASLSARGYRPFELSTVLVRPTAIPLATRTPAPAVRRIDGDEIDVWAHTAAEGWSSEGTDLAAFVEGIGQVTARAAGVHCFLAEIDGQPVAAATLNVQNGVALLAGASTIPSARKQGAQLALLAARLRFAAEHGITLAMMVALPGSGSQRNAERQGFRTVYTRTKWKLPA